MHFALVGIDVVRIGVVVEGAVDVENVVVVGELLLKRGSTFPVTHCVSVYVSSVGHWLAGVV